VSASSRVGDDVHLVAIPSESVQRALCSVLRRFEGDVVIVLAHQEHLGDSTVRVIQVLVQPESNGDHGAAPEFGVTHDLTALLAPDSTTRTVLNDRQLSNPVVVQVVVELADLVVAGHVTLLGSCSCRMTRTLLEVPDRCTRAG